MTVLENKFHNFHSQTGQTSFQLLTEYVHNQTGQTSFQLLTELNLLVLGSPKGSPNTSKIRQNIRRYLTEKCLIIYKYELTLHKENHTKKHFH